LSATVTKLAIN